MRAVVLTPLGPPPFLSSITPQFLAENIAGTFRTSQKVREGIARGAELERHGAWVSPSISD